MPLYMKISQNINETMRHLKFRYISIICNHENNVPSRLPQWLCGKSWTWAHDVWLQHCSSCAQVHELPQSHCGDNREGTLCS